MLRKYLLMVVLSSCCSLSLQAAPVPEKPQTLTTAPGVQHDKQAVEALARSLESIHSLSAHFEQQALTPKGRRKTESGEVFIKRPGQFRWNTRQPFQQSIVSREDKIWMVDIDLMQVVIKKQDDTMGPTPVQLLSGDARAFLQDYQVVRLGEADKELVYTLRPVGKSELFERLDITFRKGVLTSMTLKDSLGGKRQITFSDVNINDRMDDKLFQVVIPKGFDVIDETRP